MSYNKRKTLYEKLLQNKDIICDESGKPVVFYHSFDYDNYDSGLINLSTDREYSEEFGENTEAFYIKSRKPYITEDSILRDENGEEIFFLDEPATVGYLDSIDDEYLYWFQQNFDLVMDSEGYIAVVFDKENLIPVE